MMQLLRIIRILNSDASPNAIAAAISLAMFVGLTPLFSLHNLLIILAALLFRIHLGSFILAAFGFGLLGLTLESTLENVGYWLLNHQALESTWTAIYNTQFGRLSLFNFTGVMGGFFISLVCLIPLWLVCLSLISNYREHFLSWVQKHKVMQILKGSTLIQLYQRSGSD